MVARGIILKHEQYVHVRWRIGANVVNAVGTQITFRLLLKQSQEEGPTDSLAPAAYC